MDVEHHIDEDGGNSYPPGKVSERLQVALARPNPECVHIPGEFMKIDHSMSFCLP